MRVLIFDLIGKMAHFRKYYTNSSSLSYYFPPRTTINGLIAGIIGLKRDTYYELFSKEKAFVGVAIKSKIRKIFQVVNYIWAESITQLNLSKGQHTQIPVEIVLPEDLNSLIRYRIFFFHTNNEVLNQVYEMVKNNRVVYPPYLGISEFLAKLEFIDFVEPIIEKTKDVKLTSILNLDYLIDGELIKTGDKLYIKERMPYDFNKYRVLSEEPKDFLIEFNSQSIEFKSNREIEVLNLGEDKVLFMWDLWNFILIQINF